MFSTNRRDLLSGLAAGGALAIGGISPVFATPAPISLAVVKRTIEVNNRSASVYGILQPDGRQGLDIDAGGNFSVALKNATGEPTIMHWHGLTPPWLQDGVAGITGKLLAPGETKTYGFPLGLDEVGIHWMHSHTLQEQMLLDAPLIVRGPFEKDQDVQEVVVILNDFTFTAPEEILARLKKAAGQASPSVMMRMSPETMASGEMTAMSMGAGHDGMALDLNDVNYDAYIANERTLDDPQIVQVEKGGRVRLRIINAGTATNFTIDLGGLDGKLIAVDGQPVRPIGGSRFPMAIAQRLDILVSLPNGGGAFPVFALREGELQRSGIILTTPGATVGRISVSGEVKGPIVDSSLEAQLSALKPLDQRSATRRFTVDLVGDMATYTWGMRESAPLNGLKIGERVEIVLVNKTSMAHPMHIHGHRFQVIGVNGVAVIGAVRDTVQVPAFETVTIAFDARNPGRWAFHCHNLYHMAAGMMTTITYEGFV